eukprot:1139715-Pyramimonas_sp.AAC.1
MSGIKAVKIEDGIDWRRGSIRTGPKGSYHYDEESVYTIVNHFGGAASRSPDEVWKRKWSNATYPYYASKLRRRNDQAFYFNSSLGFEDEPTEEPPQNWVCPLSACLDDIDDHDGYRSTDDEYEPCDQTIPVAETRDSAQQKTISTM